MTNPSLNEGAVSVVSAARLREIAAIRLACAQAMLALASQQPSVLSAIDAAAQGELGQGEAEEILSAHLAGRESCIDAMRSFDSEWRQLAADAVQWSASEVDDVQAVSRGFLALLAEIESSDTLFARELAARRRTASIEIARADSGIAAHRAYGPARGEEPRFTDRRG
jgi:hypothetical protein